MRERRRNPRHASRKISNPSPRRRKLLKAWGWIGAGLVLGLLGSQGTYAFWNTSVTSSGQQVQAADFRVSVANSAGSNVQMPAGVNLSQGVPATGLFPGQSQFNEVRFGNQGTARADAAAVRLSVPSRPFARDSASSANRSFAGSLSLRVATGVPAATSCSAAAGYQDVPMSAAGNDGEALTGGPAAVLPKDGSSKWCFQTTLSANTPNGAQGRSAVISVTIGADQVPAS